MSARKSFDERLRDGEKSGKTWEGALSAERRPSSDRDERINRFYR